MHHTVFSDLDNKKIVDVYGRTFKTLRISLTNVCNLGCLYCVDGKTSRNKVSIGSYKLLADTVFKLNSILDLETIRLTGGEPTLYRDLVPLVKELSFLGIPIKLTTNGLFLSSLAGPLKEAGLKSINVSLDAIEPTLYKTMTRYSGLEKVLTGIQCALEAGIQVKINSVIMKGVNESQIAPLLTYSIQNNITLRFLELMKMGHLHSDRFDSLFFSQEQILNKIATEHKFRKIRRSHSSTANYWKLENGSTFGIIANESEPFCHDCDRLRLDSEGNLYGCLSEMHSVSIKENSMEELVVNLKKALQHKQPSRFAGSAMTMIGIGG